MEKGITKCSICRNTIGITNPEELSGKYNWTGTISNRKGVQYEFWYCPEHKIGETIQFEKDLITQ